MLRVVHHKLRVVLRLSVLLVVLGLATVPVECSSVYGPHSIFVSAEEVAQVREAGVEQLHIDHAAHHGMAGMMMLDDHAAIADTHAGEPTTLAPEAGDTSSLPAPASTAFDALIAIALFEPDRAPGPRSFEAISRVLPLPTGSIVPAPEPPPPQLGF